MKNLKIKQKNLIMALFLILFSSIFFISCENKEEKEERKTFAKEMSLNYYEERLDKWPVPFEELMVNTRYGKTHVIASGPKEGEPIVLIHAMGVGSTLWLPNIEALSEKHRVYAVDTIGDLNKSVLDDLSHYPKKGAEYSQWLTDVFDELAIDKAYVIGASMGGWLTLNHAVYAKERVSKIALLGPMGIKSNVAKVAGKITEILLNPSENNKRQMIAWALGENPKSLDAFANYMYLAVEAPGKMGFPGNLKKEELKKINVPVLLLLGEKDRPIGNPKPIQKRAEKYIKNITVIVIPNSGHLMNIDESEIVNNLLF